MEIRTLEPEERPKLLELLDAWPLADGWRGRDYFGRLMEFDPTYADENVWVAARDGDLLACVQIFPRRLRVLGHAVPVGGIGSVFTRPDSRGSGLATKLLESAIAAMVERGFELSILITTSLPFYQERGWASWTCSRTILRLSDPEGVDTGEIQSDDANVEFAEFDLARDFDAVKAIHSVYSASRDGTVVRDDGLWLASLDLAGNPKEEFLVARRDGKTVAYVRSTLLGGAFTITELARLEDAAGPLAAITTALLRPRSHDPLVPDQQTSREMRAFAAVPAFDDLPLTVAMEQRGVSVHPMEDPSHMLRCIDAGALGQRLDVSLLPDETGEEFLRRILPSDTFVFWPADRF